MRKILISTLFLLVGCAANRFTPEEGMSRFDDRTDYRVENAEDGFTLYVWYQHYQAFKSTKNIVEEGKQALCNVAFAVSDKCKKPIEQVNEQRIKYDVGRTFWGITSYSATVKCFYKKD
jgi:hypothetical protein